MGWIDCIVATTLDLVNHPENASNYAVALLGRVAADPTPAGTQPSSKSPKTLQLVRAARIPNISVPPGLNDLAEQNRRGLVESGVEKECKLVRVMWISEHTQLATLYLARCFNDAMISFVRQQKQPGPGGRPIPVTTEWLIR